jgi:hypothetical protein
MTWKIHMTWKNPWDIWHEKNPWDIHMTWKKSMGHMTWKKSMWHMTWIVCVTSVSTLDQKRSIKYPVIFWRLVTTKIPSGNPGADWPEPLTSRTSWRRPCWRQDRAWSVPRIRFLHQIRLIIPYLASEPEGSFENTSLPPGVKFAPKCALGPQWRSLPLSVH